jgi:hypothetical protein
VESVVGLLEDEYPDEHQMLRFLGQKDVDGFGLLAESDPALCEHLIGYGIVARGAKSFYFRIGVVERYFEAVARPPHLLDQDDRLAEISARRNEFERNLRKLAFQVFRVSTAPRNRLEHITSKLSEGRKKAVEGVSFDELLAPGESPLFFDELKAIILGHWEKFSNILEIPKSEFEYHMNTINRFRSDAHAKTIDDQAFQKWRVSISELSSRVE